MIAKLKVDQFTHPTEFWHRLPDGRVQCDLCPRACKLREGQRGFCFVRANSGGKVVLTTYGRSSGFCIDPIEKKPLNHFHPGTPVFSFGTAGCNLACRFCQNWDISKSRSIDTLADQASPEAIASTAADHGCRSVAFTYNDPVIFHEYAQDVAEACHQRGLLTVAVTANYLTEQARESFYSGIDAANVDLKAFTDGFYRRLTGARLQPVLENLEWLVRETDVWVELTTLLIPGENDSEPEITSMCEWVMQHLGSQVPMHFTAFHPDYLMRDVPPTPLSTLRMARRIAMETGIHFVYTGNAYDPEGQATYCPGCGEILIGRCGYGITEWNIGADGRCQLCGNRPAGHFDARPGHWGSRRLPVRMAPF
ncbi:MAG: AmmeMemoRadiSam system radical SAM enzyme [Oceanipulchritudo sp.]